MKVEVLQASTCARDTSGALLVVGAISEVDPALGNAWACAGLVRVVEHDKHTGPVAEMVREPLPEPEENDRAGRVYILGPDGQSARDYHAERMARKRDAAKPSIKPKRKPKRKDTENDSD